MRLGGLGRDDDVGAVARGAKRDRLADAAACAGDEQGLSGKAHGRQSPGVSFGLQFIVFSLHHFADQRPRNETPGHLSVPGVRSWRLTTETGTGDCLLLDVGVAAVLANPHPALLVHVVAALRADAVFAAFLVVELAVLRTFRPRPNGSAGFSSSPSSGSGLGFSASSGLRLAGLGLPARTPGRRTSRGRRQTARTHEGSCDDRSS